MSLAPEGLDEERKERKKRRKDTVCFSIVLEEVETKDEDDDEGNEDEVVLGQFVLSNTNIDRTIAIIYLSMSRQQYAYIQFFSCEVMCRW